MKPFLLVVLSCVAFPGLLIGQMRTGQDTLYGNEWFKPGSSALQITITKDGWYRLPAAVLHAAGLPKVVQGSTLRLFALGSELPLMVSSESLETPDDFIAFFGNRGRAGLDRFLFEDPDNELLNPEYGLFSDTMTYFLVWDSDASNPPVRYEEYIAELLPSTPVQEWVWSTTGLVAHQHAVFKRYDASNLVALSSFDACEGFASEYLNTHEIVIDLPEAIATDEFEAILHLRMASWFEPLHQLSVAVNGQVIHESNHGPYELIDLQLPISDQVASGTAVVEISGSAGNTDRFAVSIAQISYRCLPDADSTVRRAWVIPPAPMTRALHVLGNTTPSPQEAWLISPKNAIVMAGQSNNGQLAFALPPSTTPDTCLFHVTSQLALQPTEIRLVTFSDDLFAADAQYILLTHHALRDGGTDRVAEYADYRRSDAGGGFRVAEVDVDEVYLHFGYGITGHPLAIRNFFAHAARNWHDARYVLLLGHGLVYPEVRDAGSPHRNTHFLPTWGVPGSDNLLLSSPGEDAPLFAVGRIAARSPEEVGWYLEKIKEYESGFVAGQTVELQAWRKNILHLVGGNPSEQQSFRFLLDLMAQDLSASDFGARLNTVVKTSSEPVQSSPSQTVIDAVNSGVAVKTFLGHGAVAATGFGLDAPGFFNHHGRYPFILSLGCLSGNVFDPQNSVSERFVLAEKAGSIGYVASSGFGFAGTLASFGRDFYQLLGSTMYGRGVGEIVQAIKQQLNQSPSFPVKSLVQQLHVHADPALRLSNRQEPDFIIDFSSIRHAPFSLSSTSDSFQLTFDILNLGRNTADSLVMAFERVSENGVRFQWMDTVWMQSPILTYKTQLPVGGPNFRGENTVLITIDPDDNIAEAPLPDAELNNSLGHDQGAPGYVFFVEDQSAHPVNPPPFAMVDSPPELVASLNDPLGPARVYVMQIDTTARFDSPFRKVAYKVPERGLLRWQPEISWEDETVYYWRIRPDSAMDSWQSSSFCYVAGLSSRGWNQSHIFQWQENLFDKAGFRDTTRRLEFAVTQQTVIAEAMVTSPLNQDRSRYFINNDRYLRTTSAWGRNLTIVVIDPETGLPRQKPGTQVNGFTFPVFDAEDRAEVMSFLRDSIPQGSYALFFTWHQEGESYNPELWAGDTTLFGSSIFDLLEAQGAQRVRELEGIGSRPYVFAWRQHSGPIGEALGEENQDRVSVLFDMTLSWSEGAMRSSLIGPSINWERVAWEVNEIDPLTDNWSIELFGHSRPDAGGQLLLEGLSPAALVLLPDTTADAFPWLSFRLAMSDTVHRTPPQLGLWRVYGSGTGDAAFLPDRSPGAFYTDTVLVGEPFQFNMQAVNLLPTDMGPLLVRLTWTDPQNRRTTDTLRLEALKGLDSLLIDYTTRTEDFSPGPHQFTIELNALDDQPEGNRQNNRILLPVQVLADQSSPFLAVTFDGKTIADGAIVSSRPRVDMWLRDEHPWLPVTDIQSIDAQWRYEGENWRHLKPSDQDVTFQPQTLSGGGARLVWHPFLDRDGWYELKVTGKDASGNPAGVPGYQIGFRVIGSQSLSNLVAFPNPMTATCRFAYTLTGSETPREFMVEVFDVRGTLVRTFDEASFGPLTVGSHVSELVWDGTDQAGNELPSGVYLFRVRTADKEGRALPHFPDSSVSGGSPEIGRIVIVR